MQPRVATIKHRPTQYRAGSIEIPGASGKSLALDSGRHLLRLDELNRCAWPGYDLRHIPGQPDRYDYGFLPPGLFRKLRDGILVRQKARAGRVISRDEK